MTPMQTLINTVIYKARPRLQPHRAKSDPDTYAPQPALRADVSRVGEALRPRHFNLHVFRPNGSPVI